MTRPRLISSILILAIALIALPASAAELILKVDKEKKQVAVTNTLPFQVVLLSLVGPDKRRLPLFAKLESKATVEVPLRFTMPATIDHATCEIHSPPEGFRKPDDNRNYSFSVSLQ